jgi:predicted metal-dependent hydrolase
VDKHSLLELAVAEFNSGRFFESHDSFEIMWESLQGDDRRFMQGMIHAAIGSFHAARSNHAGATTQIERAIERLAEHRPEKFGIDVSKASGSNSFKEEIMPLLVDICNRIQSDFNSFRIWFNNITPP